MQKVQNVSFIDALDLNLEDDDERLDTVETLDYESSDRDIFFFNEALRKESINESL